MTEETDKIIEKFMNMASRLTGWGGDIFGRKIICTPCDGNYGYLVAWFITIEGSPVRAIFVVMQHEDSFNDPIFYIDGNKRRAVCSSDKKVIREFQREFLSIGRTKSDSVKVVSISKSCFYQ